MNIHDKIKEFSLRIGKDILIRDSRYIIKDQMDFISFIEQNNLIFFDTPELIVVGKKEKVDLSPPSIPQNNIFSFFKQFLLNLDIKDAKLLFKSENGISAGNISNKNSLNLDNILTEIVNLSINEDNKHLNLMNLQKNQIQLIAKNILSYRVPIIDSNVKNSTDIYKIFCSVSTEDSIEDFDLSSSTIEKPRKIKQKNDIIYNNLIKKYFPQKSMMTISKFTEVRVLLNEFSKMSNCNFLVNPGFEDKIYCTSELKISIQDFLSWIPFLFSGFYREFNNIIVLSKSSIGYGSHSFLWNVYNIEQMSNDSFNNNDLELIKLVLNRVLNLENLYSKKIITINDVDSNLKAMIRKSVEKWQLENSELSNKGYSPDWNSIELSQELQLIFKIQEKLYFTKFNFSFLQNNPVSKSEIIPYKNDILGYITRFKKNIVSNNNKNLWFNIDHVIDFDEIIYTNESLGLIIDATAVNSLKKSININKNPDLSDVILNQFNKIRYYCHLSNNINTIKLKKLKEILESLSPEVKHVYIIMSNFLFPGRYKHENILVSRLQKSGYTDDNRKKFIESYKIDPIDLKEQFFYSFPSYYNGYEIEKNSNEWINFIKIQNLTEINNLLSQFKSLDIFSNIKIEYMLEIPFYQYTFYCKIEKNINIDIIKKLEDFSISINPEPIYQNMKSIFPVVFIKQQSRDISIKVDGIIADEE
jgi:hypothetical protein